MEAVSSSPTDVALLSCARWHDTQEEVAGKVPSFHTRRAVESSSEGKGSKLALFVHPSISLFTLHFLCWLKWRTLLSIFLLLLLMAVNESSLVRMFSRLFCALLLLVFGQDAQLSTVAVQAS